MRTTPHREVAILTAAAGQLPVVRFPWPTCPCCGSPELRTRTTANAVIDGILAELTNPANAPTGPGDVIASAFALSPASI